jgi:uncharacterized NAD-dependent epimerase/dehydratase family protein
MMENLPEGNAVVYCEGAFNTTNGKTAHGLVRFTRRYRVLSVVDSRYAGKDAGEILDGRSSGIPVYRSLHDAVQASGTGEDHATHLVVGIAPDGGRLKPAARRDVLDALDLGLHVDAGLHDFLSEDPDVVQRVAEHHVQVRDVRKPPPRNALRFFSGKIEEVSAFRVAVLGTDSAVGKRTTAWLLRDGLEHAGLRTEFVGTGQTAWMQGVRFGVILDTLVNDFVAGEIEHAVWSAWKEGEAEAIVMEGQGSLMNPAYPGGFEILAAGRPDAVVFQHAPARKEYDGFPGYPLHPLALQIQAVELLSGRPVAAVAVNHENLDAHEVDAACREIHETTGLPACDVLLHGPGALLEGLAPYLERWRRECRGEKS